MERCCELIEATPLHEDVEAQYDPKRERARVRNFLADQRMTEFERITGIPTHEPIRFNRDQKVSRDRRFSPALVSSLDHSKLSSAGTFPQYIVPGL